MAEAEKKAKVAKAPKAKTEKKAKVTKPAATGAAAGSVVQRKYLGNYTKSDVKTAGGKRFAVDKNDEVAQMIRGKTVDELEKIADKHGLGDHFREKYKGKLNPGLIRMSFGNKLRGKLAEKAAKKAEKEAAPAKEAKAPAKPKKAKTPEATAAA